MARLNRSRLPGSLFSVLLFLAAIPAAAKPPTPKTVLVVSWDGAADWIVDRLLAEGKLPNVARLAKTGVRAAYSTPAYPSKTACGHAALWTGTYGDGNGITGNSVPLLPRGAHTLLESSSGFLSTSLTAEPLFVTAARAGKKVLILSATQSFPPEKYGPALIKANVPRERFLTFDGFESAIVPEQVRDGAEFQDAEDDPSLPAHDGPVKTLSFDIAGTPFTAFAFDDPKDPVKGFDTLLIRQGKTSFFLKPIPASESLQHYSPRIPITVSDPKRGELFGYTYFRLFALDPTDATMVLFQRGVNGIRGTSTVAERHAYLDAYGGFHSVPFDGYEKGLLGPPLWKGGDGEAEKRLVETIRLDCEFLKRGTRYGLRQFRPQLMFHYGPMIDSAGHQWMGILDPDSPRHDPVLAQKIMPFYEQIYALYDAWLGEMIEDAGPEAAICLVSDHGMAGVAKRFSPNAVLQAAGLLTRTTDGKAIDLTKTKICAPPWGDYFVSVNGVDWKNGIVPPSEREQALDQATDALLAVRDPETGRPVVTRVFRPTEVVGLGIGGEAGGDLYLDLAPGYVPTGRLEESPVSTIPSPIGNGVHGFLPIRKKMQAIFFLGGKGIVPGKEIPGVRQIDVAPTLSYLLGIPAPANAVGHLLGECFP